MNGHEANPLKFVDRNRGPETHQKEQPKTDCGNGELSKLSEGTRAMFACHSARPEKRIQF